MKIYSMTATFGKLEHQTLTLEPGLNLIQAPNEWGKSTWCAFLLAMLYGLDTRAKSTRSSLSDRERYAPWSGSPMSGQMELCWNGRDITLQRSTRGRVPLGAFRAYETQSGLEVPELTASNCGQQLLGVERSVFQRAGFIRQAELPVTQDEALRRRLNALVTTGDESGDGARLEKGLRELKNRCRYNQSGLLPQARQEQRTLQATLAELTQLQTRQEALERQLAENGELQRQLSNHAAALAYAQAQEERRRVTQAEQARHRAEQQLHTLESRCVSLPSLEQTERKLSQLRQLREELESLQEAQHSLPLPPELPQAPECFLGLTPAQAREQAERDCRDYRACSAPRYALLLCLGLLCLGLLCLGGAGMMLWHRWLLPGAAAGAAGLLAAALALLGQAKQRKRRKNLYRRYGSRSPEEWAEDYDRAVEEYRRRELSYRQSGEALAARRQTLRQRRQSLCGDRSVEQCGREWEQTRQLWLELAQAQAEYRRAVREQETLSAMIHPAPPPAGEDKRTETAAQTAALLQQAREEERWLRDKSGECRGRMESLGSREALQRRLEQVEGRVRELERYQDALELAQQTLTEASRELQRRFAPRISQEAQRILSRLTLGRYDRLTLDADLSVQSGAGQEDGLRDERWRSDGTADQLYLALRLAVAQALTPEAPLILDDALVRFDEERLKAAMAVLEELSASRQVILFTCQQREQKAISSPSERYPQPLI